MFAAALDNEFARDVRAGLMRPGQKTLPCSYFYDDVGSALFEAITCLSEYGLTRADARIIEAHAGELIDALPAGLIVAELGSGSGTKTRTILRKLRAREATLYYPIDCSAAALEKCARDLGTLASVCPMNAAYLDGLREVAELRPPDRTLLVLFLGSTIGNFESAQAIDFLYAIRRHLRPGDALLLGTDLVKPTGQLIAAYDDAAGVTAAFNRNLLARINHELDADFDLRQFEHVVLYRHEAQRIEMHLRSRVAQTVTIPKADIAVDFAPGETIWTEACHKFRPEQICAMARAAGFHLSAQWLDAEWPFAESLLVASEL